MSPRDDGRPRSGARYPASLLGAVVAIPMRSRCDLVLNRCPLFAAAPTRRTMHLVTRRLILLCWVAALLAACGGQAGYGGPRVDGALRAVVRPAGSPHLLSAGTRVGRPFLYTQILIKNMSSQPLRVHRCMSTALDERGVELFRERLIGPDVLFRPGERVGSLKPGTFGGQPAPPGVTLSQARAVARYAVSCEVFIWVGPFPTYEGD